MPLERLYLEWFQMTVEKPIGKQLVLSVTTRAKRAMNQSESQGITCTTPAHKYHHP